MKFRVTMKDPDVLQDAASEAAEKSLDEIEGIDDDERNALLEERSRKLNEVAAKWFEYGEYLTVEIDTEAGTCTVVPR